MGGATKNEETQSKEKSDCRSEKARQLRQENIIHSQGELIQKTTRKARSKGVNHDKRNYAKKRENMVNYFLCKR